MGVETIEITDTFEGNFSLEFNYNPYYVQKIKELPVGTRRWCPEDKRWEVDATMLDKLIAWLKDIPFFYKGKNERMKAVTEEIKKEKTFEVLQEQISDKFLLGRVKPKIPLLDYQIRGVNFLVSNEGAILADLMGCGKTCQAIIACECLMNRFHEEKNINPKILVVTKSAIRHSWLEEIEKFTESSAILVQGTPAKRRKLLAEDYTYYIITYDNVKSHLEELKEKNFGCIILDEAHLIKNPDTQRAKAIFKLKAPYQWALTGTPLINKPLEAYSLLRWSKQPVESYWNFKHRYAVLDDYNNPIAYKGLDALRTRLHKVMIRRCRKLDVDVTRLVRYVTLNKQQRELYNTVEENVLTKLSNGEQISYSIALTQLLRLRQITSHPECVGASGIKSSKEDELASILEEVIEDNNQKAVVFTQFIPALESMVKRFAKYHPVVVRGGDKNAQEKVKRLQEDEDCKLFIGSLKACREGLTLTSASYCIFLDEDWSEAYNEQNEYRIIRIGQKSNVTIIRLRAENTVDTEKIEKYLKDKKIIINKMMKTS